MFLTVYWRYSSSHLQWFLQKHAHWLLPSSHQVVLDALGEWSCIFFCYEQRQQKTNTKDDHSNPRAMALVLINIFCSLQKQKRGGGGGQFPQRNPGSFVLGFTFLFCFVLFFQNFSVSFHACLHISQLKHILEKITDGRLIWQRNITS